MRLVLALVALAALVAAHAPTKAAAAHKSTAPATVEEARAHLAAMSTGDRARFVQRCKRRQDNGGGEQAAAEPAEAKPKTIGAQPERNPEDSLRTWTDVISGPYNNGGPAVDMCVLAVVERAMHTGMVDVLNAEATTAGAAIQELSKNRVTTDGVDLTAVTKTRPQGTAQIGTVPGGNYKANPPHGNPPNIQDFVSAKDIRATHGDAGIPAKAAAPPAPAAAFLQASASQDGDAAQAAGAEATADAAAKPTVSEAAPEGFQRLEPLPGFGPQPPVDIYPRTAVGGNLAATSHYGIIHSYVEDLGVLATELSESQAKAQKLRMMIVEKDNFLSGLQKREKLLRIDMTYNKQTLAALSAHIQAVEARLGRLKQERQLSEIAAQKHQFDSATAKLNVELGGIRAVSNALDDRIKYLDTGVSAHMAAEIDAMRRSVQPAVAAGLRRDEGAAAAVAEATGGAAPEASLLQVKSASLRGSKQE